MSGSDSTRYLREARWKLFILGPLMVVLAVFGAVIGVTSHQLGRTTTTAVCTVDAVTPSRLRDGTAVWDVSTSCGGALAIDTEATTQTPDAAATLAASLQPGQEYRLRMRGQLHNLFDITAYLESATRL